MKNQLKNPHFYLMFLGDACLFAVALTFAYLFRFEFSLDAFYVRQLKQMLIFVLPLKLFTFFLFDLYKGMWRYTSTRDFWRLLQASLTSMLPNIPTAPFLPRFSDADRRTFHSERGFASSMSMMGISSLIS